MSDPTDSPSPKRTRRPDITRDEAKRRLVDATIELAREHSRLAEVTVRGIAERAGLNVIHITRNFGSREGVLLATREKLGLDVAEQFTTGGGMSGLMGTMRNNPDLILRTRIEAHLLLGGVEPSRFDRSGRNIEAMRALIAEQLGVGERAARAATLKMHLMLLASAAFAEIVVTEGVDPNDLVLLLNLENNHLRHFERELGWTDEPRA